MGDLPRCCMISLGNTHITAVIAQIHNQDHIEVIGFGHTQNRGMEQGAIVSMDKLVAGIKQAIQYAEDMADCRVHSAWLCIPSLQLRSFNCSGRVSCLEGEVSATHIVQSLTKAKHQHLVDDYYVVNHMQHGIGLDDNEELTTNPIGMVAEQIEGFYHLLMLPVATMQNIQRALDASDIHIERIVLANIATCEYALLPDERELGVCLIDIGASATHVSVYYEDKLLLTHHLPVGGDMVTRDISTELNISLAEAERIKTLHANIYTQEVDASKMLNIPARGDYPEVNVGLRQLSEVAAARYEDILLAALEVVEHNHLLPALARGVVYAGGGVQVQGFTRFARKLTGLPAQLANFPPQIKAAPNEKKQLERYYYQACLGTLLYGQSEHFVRNTQSEPVVDDSSIAERLLVKPYQALLGYLAKLF